MRSPLTCPPPPPRSQPSLRFFNIGGRVKIKACNRSVCSHTSHMQSGASVLFPVQCCSGLCYRLPYAVLLQNVELKHCFDRTYQYVVNQRIGTKPILLIQVVVVTRQTGMPPCVLCCMFLAHSSPLLTHV